jgi:ferredoxin
MARVHTIKLEGIDTVITAAEGRRLVLAIEDAGVDILHRCGGNARCATCRIEVLDGEPSPITDAEGPGSSELSAGRQTPGFPARSRSATI